MVRPGKGKQEMKENNWDWKKMARTFVLPFLRWKALKMDDGLEIEAEVYCFQVGHTRNQIIRLHSSCLFYTEI